MNEKRTKEAAKIAEENRALKKEIEEMKEKLGEGGSLSPAEEEKGPPSAPSEEEGEEQQDASQAPEKEPEKPPPVEPPEPKKEGPMLAGIRLADEAGSCLLGSSGREAGGVTSIDRGGDDFETAGCAKWSVEKRWKTC